jgi:hypothetical protein
LINLSIEYLFNINYIFDSVIYVHNLGRFDSLLLVKYCKYKFDIFLYHNSIYKLCIYCDNEKYITFHDSFKILNSSLESACKAFQLDENDSKIKIDYNKFKLNNIFEINFKNEVIKYLKNDVLSLYKIMYFFTVKVFSEYNILPQNYLTLASLSFQI